MSGNFAMINGIVCYKKHFESQKNWLTQRKKNTHPPPFVTCEKKPTDIRYKAKEFFFGQKRKKLISF